MVLHDVECINCLFELFWDKDLRNLMLLYILDLMKAAPTSKDDQSAKLQLCSRYLETFTQVKEKEKDFAEVSVELLAGMREMLQMDRASVNQKRHGVSLHVSPVKKKWHYLCITHSVDRAFSGGSVLKCYLDGDIVSSEKCRYPKVNDPLTKCAIGTKIPLPFSEEENTSYSIKDISPFFGQIGPVYLFNDAISQESLMRFVNNGRTSYLVKN